MNLKKTLKKTVRSILNIFKEERQIPIVQTKDEVSLLSGKVAFITGGTSGIGLAIAKRFVASGCKVVICGSNEKKLQNVLASLSDSVKGIQFDVSDVQACDDVIEKVIESFPERRIDILVNCAGIVGTQSFGEITEQDFDRIMDVNLKGTFFVSQAVCNYMIKNNIKGHVLNISSSSALRPAKDPYQISKWAINGFTKGLADLMIPYGIVVNAIAPGQTFTPMLGKEENETIYHSSCPAGRYVMPEEVANMALLLASDMGNMIVGDTCYITGGSGTISLHK